MDKFMALTVFARVVEQGGFTAAATSSAFGSRCGR